MIDKNQRLKSYLNAIIDRVFKALPLYEEFKREIRTFEEVDLYVESFIFELDGWEDEVDLEYSAEYKSLMNTLKSIRKEIAKENSEHAVVKRETFRCIHIIKNIVAKIENGESHELY